MHKQVRASIAPHKIRLKDRRNELCFIRVSISAAEHCARRALLFVYCLLRSTFHSVALSLPRRAAIITSNFFPRPVPYRHFMRDFLTVETAKDYASAARTAPLPVERRPRAASAEPNANEADSRASSKSALMANQTQSIACINHKISNN